MSGVGASVSKAFVVCISLSGLAAVAIAATVGVGALWPSTACACGTPGSEAYTAIGSIKRNIEVYAMEQGQFAPDLATLEAANYAEPEGYLGEHYRHYTWSGHYDGTRFVGTITAHPRAPRAKPVVSITYHADGGADVERSSR